MKTLDRYVAGSFLGIFLGALVTVSFLFTVISVLDSINRLVGEEGASLWAIISFYLLQLPQTIYMGAPVASLLSTMITLGQMNQHNELMAMRASGISLARITAPILAVTLVICFGLFALGNTLVPVGNRHFYSAKDQLKGEESDPESRLWYVAEDGSSGKVILRVEKGNRHRDSLSGVSVFVTDERLRLKKEMMAEEAVYIPGEGWEMEDVKVREFTEEGPPSDEVKGRLVLPILDTSEDLLRVQRLPEEMTLSELNEQIGRIGRYGVSDQPYRVERHSRFAIPLAALILVLVGAPLAIKPVRSAGMALSILLAVVIGFGYFVIIAEFLSLGKGGIVEPWAAAWSANLVFGLIGIALFSGMRR